MNSMDKTFKAKISQFYYNRDIRGRVFVFKNDTGLSFIQYSVGKYGLQKKTKYHGKLIPSGFFEKV